MPHPRIILTAHFNPRAPCGARRRRCIRALTCRRFQSTRPLRGATSAFAVFSALASTFQSTRPLRGATAGLECKTTSSFISIHAPLAGRDSDQCRYFVIAPISIHAPLAGRDKPGRCFALLRDIFQSTRPLRGATRFVPKLMRSSSFQSTRPLRGATLCLYAHNIAEKYFNPRAPCGARHISSNKDLHAFQFQSTRPLRGATKESRSTMRRCRISIHAPLAGRDNTQPKNVVGLWHFNPRAPCGARPGAAVRAVSRKDFNPRAPCGARRRLGGGGNGRESISIHAPLAGRDPPFLPATAGSYHFNPRAPCGARQ